MLVLRPIGGEQARYYLDGPAAGLWLGGGVEELGLQGPVVDAALHAVLAGRRPDGPTLPARIPKNRRCGFDLILAAPKSVSLVAALGDPRAADRMLAAHEQAVRSTIGYLERNAVWTRRSGARIATSGLVAAAFTHRQSGAGDPHIHSHVVVANLVQGADAKWSALDSRSLFRHARAAGAVYQATLRHHLSEQQLRFGWTVRPSGLGDIHGVPRAAIEAGSLRHRQVADQLASGLVEGPKARAVVAGVTRRGNGTEPEEPWAQRVSATGFDRAAAARLITQAERGHSIAPGAERPVPADRAVAALLSHQHSQFQRADAVRAVAVLSVHGASGDQLEAAADRFLRTAVPLEPGSWTTVQLRQMEERIIATAVTPGRSGPGVGLVRPTTPRPESLTEPALRAVERLTRGGAPVDLLAGGFLGQAEVLDAARTGWSASGHRVTLVTQTPRALARWRALAGLDGIVMPGVAKGPMDSTSPAAPKATVLVVDGADRWSTADLHRLTSDAAARRAKVVLLDGGSQSRRRQPESPALVVLRHSLPAIDAGPFPPAGRALDQRAGRAPDPPASRAPDQYPGRAPDPPAGRAPDQFAGRAPDSATQVVNAGRDAAVTVAPSGSVAIDRIVADWSRLRAAGDRPRMVALGREEVEVLNTRARAVLATAGALRGPAVEVGGRPFQAGDEVAMLRPDRRLGLASGSVGRVSSVDPAAQQVSIHWSGRDDPVVVAADRAPAALGYAYATTPAYLRNGHDGPLLSLGAAEALVPRLRPDRIYTVLARPADRARDGPPAIAALVADVADPRLEAAFPPAGVNRPLSELARERDQLARRLLAGAPADPRPALRQLGEEREWLVAVPSRPGLATAVADLDRRSAGLSQALGERTRWLDAHREPLRRWAELSQAVAWREAALGLAAEIRPPEAVVAQLGWPPPAGEAHDAAWRRAAQAIEVHRDRGDLPDRQLEVTLTRAQASLTRGRGEERHRLDLSAGPGGL